MSIAAGLAIGYFIWQLVVNNKEGGAKTTGRLHKSTKDKKIAGVCGGIAEYLNTDPTIIRLVFALLVLGWIRRNLEDCREPCWPISSAR